MSHRRTLLRAVYLHRISRDHGDNDINCSPVEGEAETALVEIPKKIDRPLLQQPLARQCHLNDTLPVNRIPPEVLSIVFEMFVHLWYGFDWNCNRGDGWMWDKTLSWHKPAITQVCSRWRNIAIGTPSLWRAVYSEFSPVVNAILLARSRQTPIIAIFCGPPYSSWDKGVFSWRKVREELLPVAAESHRLECLQLRCSSCKLNELSSFFSSPAPTLKYLDLSLYNADPPIEDDYDNLSRVLTDIFANHAPNLRVLRLEYVLLPWSSPLFGPHLTELKIDHMTHQWPSVQEFVAILTRCPSLETIALSELARVPKSTVQLLSTLPKVRMNGLKSLVLRRGDGFSLGVVLGHLQAPVEELQLEALSPEDDTSQNFLIQQLLEPCADPNFRSIGTALTNVLKTLRVMLTSLEWGSISIDVGDESILNITGPVAFTHNILHTLQDHNSPRFQHISFDVACREDQPAISQFIQYFSDTIHSLKFDFCSAGDIVGVIFPDAETEDHNVLVPFPLLRQIRMTSCSFDSNLLIQGLKRRYENQKRSDTLSDISLIMVDSTINQDDFGELVKILGKDRVEWDGVFGEFSSSDEDTDDEDPDSSDAEQ